MSVENVSSGLVPQGQKASDYDNSDPEPPRQNVVPSAEKPDSSHQGLEFLFSPLLEEYYNPTHDQAEENNNDQAPNASRQWQILHDRSNAKDELPQFDRLKEEEEVYVAQPEGFVDQSNQKKSTFLRKALYGLKQAPRALTTADPPVPQKGPDALILGKALLEGYSSLVINLKLDVQRKKPALAMDFTAEDRVENGIIELYFVRTEYQLADMFTKALPEDQFKYLVRRIGMRCLTPADLEVLTNETA
ncbi:retrovirus-related pol polyprotein from transposon TNT 1-94 [Tanacetum coccineum]